MGYEWDKNGLGIWIIIGYYGYLDFSYKEYMDEMYSVGDLLLESSQLGLSWSIQKQANRRVVLDSH